MAFNSPTFLFLFLPVFLTIFAIGGKSFHNIILLVFSLLFFFWSDPLFCPLIFLLTLGNYLLLQGIQRSPLGSRRRVILLAAGITLNILCLVSFKAFIVYGQPHENLAAQYHFQLPGRVVSFLLRLERLPLGFSFLTFQAISMLIDGFREEPVARDLFLHVLTSLLVFPKAIAGPLVRFRKTIQQIKKPNISMSRAADGLRRFMFGFAKKTLIADQLSLITDQGIFNQPPHHIPLGISWLVIISFSLQIYFDFSAYTDMAIGLGYVVGFDFPENFNYPYISTTISDFWRRWHITLSNWFRDYVFYPLERKRGSMGWLCQPINIFIVFLLTGLWHGITPPFVIWGLIHGSAIALEQSRFGGWLQNLWLPLRHLYVLSIIMLGWVFFRSPNLLYAVSFLRTLFRFSHSAAPLPFTVFPPVSSMVWMALIVGLIFSTPVKPLLDKLLAQKIRPEKAERLIWVQNTLALVLFMAGIIVQTGTNYQPFIYGEF